MANVSMTGRRWAIVALIVLVVAAVLATGVIAGQFRTADPEAFRASLGTGDTKRIADIAAADGLGARGVFVQRTDAGQVCVWDAPSAASQQRQGGCNSAADPLGGSALSASLAYDGGPGVQSVRDARLIGLVARDVASVVVVMTDGTERAMSLRKASIGSAEYRAFGYRLKRSDLRKGIGPAAVIARDAAGTELARQATGIAG